MALLPFLSLLREELVTSLDELGPIPKELPPGRVWLFYKRLIRKADMLSSYSLPHISHILTLEA